MTDKSEFERIVARLHNPDRNTRLAAIAMLAKLDLPESLRTLMNVAQDPDEYVRLEVITVLAKINDPAVIPILAAASKDADYSVRKQAMQGLGNYKQELALTSLLDALDQCRDPNLCKSIIYSLWRIGDTRAVPALLDLMLDDNRFSVMGSEVQDYAAHIFGQIATSDQGGAAVPILVEKLRTTMSESSRTTLMNALIRFGNTQRSALLDYLKDDDWLVRRVAARVLGDIGGSELTSYLIDALQDTDWMVRWGAAEALGEIGDPSSLPALQKAVSDPFERVRRDANIARERIIKEQLDNSNLDISS